MDVSSLAAGTALEEMQRHEAWAAIRLRDSATVTLVGGTRSVVERLVDVPLEEGPPAEGRRFDRLVAIPFRQVAERGFAAHDDGTPLSVVDIDLELEVPLADLLAALPDEEIRFADRGGFDTTDDEYAVVVEAIIDEEIGNGEGANLVIGRHYRAQVEDWDARRALTVLRRLLERERGAYWTYCFFTGDRFLVGASPGAARVGAGRGRPDEPDQRHLPAQGAHRPRSSARSGCWSSWPTRRRSTSSSWSSTRSSR